MARTQLRSTKPSVAGPLPDPGGRADAKISYAEVTIFIRIVAAINSRNLARPQNASPYPSTCVSASAKTASEFRLRLETRACRVAPQTLGLVAQRVVNPKPAPGCHCSIVAERRYRCGVTLSNPRLSPVNKSRLGQLRTPAFFGNIARFRPYGRWEFAFAGL